MENVSRIEDYKKENEEFYTKLYGDLEEIQRIQNMTLEEVQTEMLRVLHEMRMDLNKIRGDK